MVKCCVVDAGKNSNANTVEQCLTWPAWAKQKLSCVRLRVPLTVPGVIGIVTVSTSGDLINVRAILGQYWYHVTLQYQEVERRFSPSPYMLE